ncbi:hypothetical protein PIB30_016808 [Stylosanthes scabra]|uniref:Uncharacterized protein n=1 Tax=Stylosanthes scabra TaxID=79078 RepID=A0ABU6S7Q0_9FABA|nr:hypothetical protein [Stylosanthes scabra]
MALSKPPLTLASNTTCFDYSLNNPLLPLVHQPSSFIIQDISDHHAPSSIINALCTVPPPSPLRSGHHHSQYRPPRRCCCSSPVVAYPSSVPVSVAESLCLTNAVPRRVPMTLIHCCYPFVPSLFVFAILRSAALSCSSPYSHSGLLYSSLSRCRHPPGVPRLSQLASPLVAFARCRFVPLF